VPTDEDVHASDQSGETRTQSVRLGYVVVLMAVAFAGGFVARGMSGPESQPVQIQPGEVGGRTAPALDRDQLQGDLPAGHPPIDSLPASPDASDPPSTTPQATQTTPAP
jgi:hypothetical protein